MCCYFVVKYPRKPEEASMDVQKGKQPPTLHCNVGGCLFWLYEADTFAFSKEDGISLQGDVRRCFCNIVLYRQSTHSAVCYNRKLLLSTFKTTRFLRKLKSKDLVSFFIFPWIRLPYGTFPNMNFFRVLRPMQKEPLWRIKVLAKHFRQPTFLKMS